MQIARQYKPQEIEPALQQRWHEAGVYFFDHPSSQPIYSIDTPPPTVSGMLHLGHVYSYSHADFMARFWRMNGFNVFYPMGYDDNGLPTERLVEKWLGISAAQVGKQAFIEKCLEISQEAEKEYETLWKRLGLSIDWRFTYRTIDKNSRRIAQWSFIDLFQKGLAYREAAPAIWCPECHTALAQADLNDMERMAVFSTLRFDVENEKSLLVATTRPELLPACVAVFVHPQDTRFHSFIGKTAQVPLFGQWVPILADPTADPQKGTGAVMCCTFGDITDITWWRTHQLPRIDAIDRDGNMTAVAGRFAGLSTTHARREIEDALKERGLLLEQTPIQQSVRVHERCDTPVEYILTEQWFVRVLAEKDALLEAGDRIHWRPSHMRARYRAWVENLNWDWGISRQRYFGVPFPVWFCSHCGETLLAEKDQLPVDPLTDRPTNPCPACGKEDFIPEGDVMDTWMTSSMTPQIVSGFSLDPGLYAQVFPMTLRPQGHEIIRTWAFYTLLKSHYHFDTLPWKEVFISGWGIAGEGMGKISKSRGGGPLPPLEMLDRYSADAVRYWAASTGTGKDAVISEEKIQMGARLVTKLWNVARFSAPFLEGETGQRIPLALDAFSPADRWMLSRLQRVIRRVTSEFHNYEYAAARSEIENYFWDFTDNYLEMAKLRLYQGAGDGYQTARFTLYQILVNVLCLFAPVLPHVTEQIYIAMFTHPDHRLSIHRMPWPTPNDSWLDERSEKVGELLLEIATIVRRYKSEHNLALSSVLKRLQLATDRTHLSQAFQDTRQDLHSLTRAEQIEVSSEIDPRLVVLHVHPEFTVAIEA